MSVVIDVPQTTVSVVNTSTPFLDSKEQRIADIIVKIRMIGQPKEAEEDIRIDVEKKIREENITELSQVFTRNQYDAFCAISPNSCSGTQYSNWK